jgi:hypothetical protein
MHIKDFKKYFSESFDLKNENLIGDFIENGVLIEKDSNKEIPIVNYIIRLTSKEGYVSNFGLQWNTFKSTQLDSFFGFPLTANRFWTNTKWKPDDLKGKTVLEVGSGAGRMQIFSVPLNGIHPIDSERLISSIKLKVYIKSKFNLFKASLKSSLNRHQDNPYN